MEVVPLDLRAPPGGVVRIRKDSGVGVLLSEGGAALYGGILLLSPIIGLWAYLISRPLRR